MEGLALQGTGQAGGPPTEESKRDKENVAAPGEKPAFPHSLLGVC